MFEEYEVVFVRRKMRPDLAKIRSELMEICEREATYLFRLARRMEEHGCSPESVAICREEAHRLHMTGQPERILDDFLRWSFAFHV